MDWGGILIKRTMWFILRVPGSTGRAIVLSRSLVLPLTSIMVIEMNG